VRDYTGATNNGGNGNFNSGGYNSGSYNTDSGGFIGGNANYYKTTKNGEANNAFPNRNFNDPFNVNPYTNFGNSNSYNNANLNPLPYGPNNLVNSNFNPGQGNFNVDPQNIDALALDRLSISPQELTFNNRGNPYSLSNLPGDYVTNHKQGEFFINGKAIPV
jgi:hypothetical protein